MSEDVMKRYFAALNDPDALIDQDAIKDAEKRHAAASDPLERMLIAKEIADLSKPNMDALEAEFVTAAKGWVKENGIGRGILLGEGVPKDVVERIFGGGTRKSSSKRVSKEDVIAKALAGKQWTTSALEDATGASAGTVRSVIKQLVEEGTFKEDGTDPNHEGAGRAPILYVKA